MIPRYSDKRVSELTTDLSKLLRWQGVELAVIKARVVLGLVAQQRYDIIQTSLLANPPSVEEWKRLDDLYHHDLNAFVAERRRYIAAENQHLFHEDLTSYDTEEAPFVIMLAGLVALVEGEFVSFKQTLEAQAKKYRYTPMLERTHGQWAKLRSFGGRMLTWKAEFVGYQKTIGPAKELLGLSRLSGAIGNYGGNLSAELEEATLATFGLAPFYGATQIMPRTLYAPLAQSLQVLCHGLAKVAGDAWLGARSGNPIMREPFKKTQMGSSAMPHKRNPVILEQMKGLLRLVDAAVKAIVDNCQTAEGRTIEQSSVERNAWPDLFHLTLRMLTQMTKVLADLDVYADNMLREIIESRGTYASDEAKNFLAGEFAKKGHPASLAYNVVQLAAFNIFEPNGFWEKARRELPASREDMDVNLRSATNEYEEESRAAKTIQEFIPYGDLYRVDALEANDDDIIHLNDLIEEVFREEGVRARWDDIFRPSNLLKGEDVLFEKLLAA